AFRLLLLLDRDYEREPGWRTDQGAAGNVKESQFVWSRHSIESVLIEPRTLAIWLKAFLGESTPPELPAIIERAVAKADTDEELQQSAEEQLVAELLRGKVRDAKNEQQAVVRVLREARKAVSDAPAVWQRGKDRAARVLGAIREELGHEQRSQLPTDVIRLLARLDLARVPSPAAAVPPEVSAVLEHMTQGA
ncbi:MAG: hypothetical protein KC933_32150, partial [Myxococcales bacterium]|nr:hypothetical protein [Myxococcales bacterium]